MDWKSLPESHDMPSARNTRRRPINTRQNVCRRPLLAKVTRQREGRQTALCRVPFLAHSAKNLCRVLFSTRQKKIGIFFKKTIIGTAAGPLASRRYCVPHLHHRPCTLMPYPAPPPCAPSPSLPGAPPPDLASPCRWRDPNRRRPNPHQPAVMACLPP